MRLVGVFREFSENALKFKFRPLIKTVCIHFLYYVTSPHKCDSFKNTHFIVEGGVWQESGHSPVVCLPIVSQAQVRVSRTYHLEVGLSWLPQVGSCGNQVPTYHLAVDQLSTSTVLRSLLHPISPGGLCAFVGRQENLPVWSETVPQRSGGCGAQLKKGLIPACAVCTQHRAEGSLGFVALSSGDSCPQGTSV